MGEDHYIQTHLMENPLRFFDWIEEMYTLVEVLRLSHGDGMVSQWIPPGSPQLNGVSEKMIRILLDMVWFRMRLTL